MILTDPQRKALDRSVTRAREIAEAAAAEALAELGVGENERPRHLTDDQNSHRLELRAKARQLGDSTEARRAEIPLLRRDVAYEQWHRLLFARFLEQNGLLRHPGYTDTAISLEDCAELAVSEGEPDGWSLAARFASEILPGIFRLSDPAVRVRYPRERMLELEAVLAEIPLDAFRTEDALGWVYQFWQTAEKKRVNESGRKIGGADLSPVTQLFTENYMVRFLLENSLGAWWAARHPNSPLVAEWDYLRVLEDGTPAAGTFAEWPTTAAEVTVMDPCCGSGHFLVAAFGMLWRMRAEEEGLSAAEAQDAVLSDNLFGLELDQRCTQLARFNVVLEAWKQGGFRRLPVPQIACSGIPVGGTREEWEAMASNEVERSNLVRLHSLFRNADTLGSLIDPRQGSDGELLSPSLLMRDGDTSMSTLHTLLATEATSGDALGQSVIDIMATATLLTKTYAIVTTNPPFLGRGAMTAGLSNHIDTHLSAGSPNLATSMWQRLMLLSNTQAIVTPHEWQFLKSYSEFRQVVAPSTIVLTAPVGPGAFREISGEVVQVALSIVSSSTQSRTVLVDAYQAGTIVEKSLALRALEPKIIGETWRNGRPMIFGNQSKGQPLSAYAKVTEGLKPGQTERVTRYFWENEIIGDTWLRLATSPTAAASFTGKTKVVRALGYLSRYIPQSNTSGRQHWEAPAIIIKKIGALEASLSSGGAFDNNTFAIIPRKEEDLAALWAFCSSLDFATLARQSNRKRDISAGAILDTPFDKARWQAVADAAGPLPEPHSDDPTQWLFKGEIPNATHPLQVAVARLLGYRWPDQVANSLDAHTDADGIVALVPLPNEPDAVTRLRALLSAAYGDVWNTDLERTLVTAGGCKTGRLDDWLRDIFFAQHVKVFDNRPFLWHLWDGHKDGGFSAIVNYHRLDHATLNKLTHTVLGAWIERQTEATATGVTGADLRLAAAKNLQERLQLVLDGEAPFDTYVRWKETHEQSIGWDPDLDDGVRLNIRPFIEAALLRGKVNVHWKKDRGLNVDGTERHNDLHLTLAEKHAARRAHEATP